MAAAGCSRDPCWELLVPESPAPTPVQFLHPEFTDPSQRFLFQRGLGEGAARKGRRGGLPGGALPRASPRPPTAEGRDLCLPGHLLTVFQGD